MLTTAPRGTKDILPGAVNGWRYVESVLRDVCREFNYQEIRTPIFEHTELFQRGIGDGTDVVDKECIRSTTAVQKHYASSRKYGCCRTFLRRK